MDGWRNEEERVGIRRDHSCRVIKLFQTQTHVMLTVQRHRVQLIGRQRFYAERVRLMFLIYANTAFVICFCADGLSCIRDDADVTKQVYFFIIRYQQCHHMDIGPV